MTTTDAEAIARIIEALISIASDAPKSILRDAVIGEANEFLAFASRREAQEPVAPFAENGYGSRLLREAVAYLNEYVFDFDGGADHEPTEFERFMMEDMLNGLFSHEPFFGIIRNLAAPPAPAGIFDDQIIAIWRAAMTAACNIVIGRQNRLNDDDGPCDVLNEQGEIASQIKRILEPDELYIGEIRQMIGAVPAPAGEVERLRGEIAYALTKRLVIDMPTARAAIDEAFAALNGGRSE